ncbi:unnamed protein product [Vitrella brassicaformis CCMP3155]|uniref:CFAP74 third Ig-like domain-containing protein n=3 Tax=Vitrella brassicaformis TaxID=1169539 RepID=A0A0G4GJ35_VITBC|nr:unnamed protein product [Vitrella brassicaformis CCMP3155]|eukprot:CEM29836.1 unnamed protein product [Vitrella brassicaformis CCMP3155]
MSDESDQEYAAGEMVDPPPLLHGHDAIGPMSMADELQEGENLMLSGLGPVLGKEASRWQPKQATTGTQPQADVDLRRMRQNERMKQEWSRLQTNLQRAMDGLRVQETAAKEAAAHEGEGDEAAREYNRQEIQRAWKRVSECESRVHAHELQMREMDVQIPGIHRKGEADKDQHTREAATAAAHKLAGEKRKAEEKRGKRALKDLQHKIDVTRKEVAGKPSYEGETDGQRMAKMRLKKVQSAMRHDEALVREAEEDEFTAKADRIVNLKGNIDKVKSHLSAVRARHVKAENAMKERLERDKERLMSEGINPYEIFRREALKKQQDSTHSAAEGRLREGREVLARRMAAEEHTHNKDEQKRRRALAERLSQRAAAGGLNKDQQNAKYIRHKTIAGNETLDPTSRLQHIFPSKLTLIKTPKIGMGMAPPAGSAGLIHEAILTREETKLKRKGLVTQDGTQFVDPLAHEEDPFTTATQEDKQETEEEAPHARAMDTSDEDTDEEDGSDEGEGKLWVPKDTQLERSYRERARERHRKWIEQGEVQKVCNRVHRGRSFLSKPAVIQFNDFDVGEVYAQQVQLTNVSLSFNHFRTMPIEDKARDFFHVSLPPPGRMSAGTSCTLNIQFSPKVNEDVYTCLPLLAKTGREDIPIVCRKKRTVLVFDPPQSAADSYIHIRMKRVLRGESVSSVLTVKNEGALAADFHLRPLMPTEDLQTRARHLLTDDEKLINEIQQETASLDSSQAFVDRLDIVSKEGTFMAHDTHKIKFTFSPVESGVYTAAFVLDAQNTDSTVAILSCECVDVPVYIEQPIYDFNTITYGHTFRHQIVVSNRQPTAMKIWIDQPSQNTEELSFNPTMAFIQGHSSLVLNVRFAPHEGFCTRHPQYTDHLQEQQDQQQQQQQTQEGAADAQEEQKSADDEGGEDEGGSAEDADEQQPPAAAETVAAPSSLPDASVVCDRFNIPVVVRGADQVLPAVTHLTGTLTLAKINITPKQLHFGSVFVGTGRSLLVRLTNRCMLPCTYGLTKMRSIFKAFPVGSQNDDSNQNEDEPPIEKEDSIGVILGGDTQRLMVTYTPDAAMDMSETLKLKVQYGDLCAKEVPIKCTGKGVFCPIRIYPTICKLASIPVNESVRASCVIQNTSTKSHVTVNIASPPVELSVLSIGPLYAKLAPQETRRIQIAFTPTEAYRTLTDDPKPTQTDAEGTEQKEDEEKEDEQSATEPQEKADIATRIRQSGGRRYTRPDRSDTSVHCSWKIPIYFHTESNKNAGSSHTVFMEAHTCTVAASLRYEPSELRFGDVSVGEERIMHVTLTNAFPQEGRHHIRVDTLPQSSGFATVNAPRPVGSRPFALSVRFKPPSTQAYVSELRIHSERTSVSLPLSGRGVTPLCALVPTDGIVDMDALVDGHSDFLTQTVSIQNPSAYPLPYTLVECVREPANTDGLPAFSVVPAKGTVEADGQVDLTVTFRPFKAKDVYREKYWVKCPIFNSPPQYFYLYATCRKYQMYLTYDEPPCAFDRQPSVHPLATDISAADEPQEREETKTPEAAKGKAAADKKDKQQQQQQAETPIDPSRQFHLTFDKESSTSTQSLLVCCCWPPGTRGEGKAEGKGGGGNFDVAILQSDASKYFTVDSSKGTVQSGGSQKVTFSFMRDGDTTESAALPMLAGVGMWVTAQAKVVLSGGYVPSGCPSTQEFSVTLKAYVLQI